MVTLLVSLCLAQAFDPVRTVEHAAARPVGVRLGASGAAIEAFDGGFVVAWADDRRLTNLARTPIVGRDDVWVKVVEAGAAGSLQSTARLVCPRTGLTAGPRLAPGPAGVVGLAWADARGVWFNRVDAAGSLVDGACGQALSNVPSDMVELSPRGPAFSVVFNGPALTRSTVGGGAAPVATSLLFVPQRKVVAVSGPVGTTVVGWVDSNSVSVRYELSNVTANQPNVDEFDLAEGTPGPAIALVFDGGLFVGATPTTSEFKVAADSQRKPYAVAFDGGTLVISGAPNGTDTQLYWTQGLTLGRFTAPGHPEGLAARSGEGLALVSHESGVLGAIAVSAAGFQGVVAPVSLAGVLQRRPTVAWSAANAAWELVWEEATSATSFESRHGFVSPGASGVVSANELFVDGGWPRALQQFDGGLAYVSFDQVRTVFSLPRGSTTVPVDTLVGSVGGLAPGLSGAFGWGSGPGAHREFVLRHGAPPKTDVLNAEVSCATWFAGEYVVTRIGTDGGARFANFADDALPTEGISMPASRACVAARPRGAPTQLGIALVDDVALRVGTVDGGVWQVPLDAGVRDLQMTSVDGRWLVVWDTDDALMAGLFTDSEAQPLLLPIDVRPATHRGPPSLGTSPAGAVVTWPVLQADSVEVLVRVLPLGDPSVGVRDGGAGVVDAGLAVDGGQVPDGGAAAPDGGVMPSTVFVPVCGCGAGVGAALWWAALVLAFRWRRGG